MSSPAQGAASTTQLFLDIHDITNNLVIMKDGTTSVIISVDAMNFGLLAEEEQDGIIYAYAGLLNSLNYPIQIVIRSQTKDVTQYLTLLKEQEDLAPNRLMQHRIRTYREFVSNLIQERNVLDKKFYVVIPASAIELGLLAPSTVLPGSKALDLHTVERSVLLEKAKSILDPKRDHLVAQFARIGLMARELETQEIIQLFYMSYNPEAAEGQEITDSNSYTTPLVKAGMQNTGLNQATTAVVAPVVEVATPAVERAVTLNPTSTAEMTVAQSATPSVTPAVETAIAPVVTSTAEAVTAPVVTTNVAPDSRPMVATPVAAETAPILTATPQPTVSEQAPMISSSPGRPIEQEVFSTGTHAPPSPISPTATPPTNQTIAATQAAPDFTQPLLIPQPNNFESLPEIQIGSSPTTPPITQDSPLPPVAEIT